MMIQGIVIPVCPSIIFVFGIAKAQTSALSTKHITAKGNAHSIVQKVGQKRKNFQKEKLFTFLIFILLLKKKKRKLLTVSFDALLSISKTNYLCVFHF